MRGCNTNAPRNVHHGTYSFADILQKLAMSEQRQVSVSVRKKPLQVYLRRVQMKKLRKRWDRPWEYCSTFELADCVLTSVVWGLAATDEEKMLTYPYVWLQANFSFWNNHHFNYVSLPSLESLQQVQT